MYSRILYGVAQTQFTVHRNDAFEIVLTMHLCVLFSVGRSYINELFIFELRTFAFELTLNKYCCSLNRSPGRCADAENSFANETHYNNNISVPKECVLRLYTTDAVAEKEIDPAVAKCIRNIIYI